MYPRLLRRVRAALIDSVIFGVLFLVWVFGLGLVENAHAAVKIAPLVGGLLVLEPGLVSWTGGTLGHHLMKLRIRDAVEDRNIGFARAAIRALIRASLGWLSFVFILATRKHQAIHDYFSRTVVVLRNPTALPVSEKFDERVLAPAGFELPSRLRRAGVVLVYTFVSYVALAITVALVLSDSCLYSDICSTWDDFWSGLLGLGWFAGMLVIIVFGYRGQLFGCRRRRVRDAA